MRVFLSWLIVLCCAGLALAQTPSPVSVTSSDIEAVRDRVTSSTQLDADKVRQLTEQLTAAENRLEQAREAETDLREAQGFSQNAASLIAEAEADIQRLRTLPEPAEINVELMDNEALDNIEAEIQDSTRRLDALQAESQSVTDNLEAAQNRQRSFLNDLEASREALSRIDNQLQQLDTDDPSLEDDVLRLVLQTRRDFRRFELRKLEAERDVNPQRIQLYSKRRDALTLERNRLLKRVENLQAFTGQRRLNRVAELQGRVASIEQEAPDHPLIEVAAEENLELIERLESLARTAGDLPRQRAQTQEDLANVNQNLSIARQLTELGDLDRRAAETLRRLRATVPVGTTIESALERSRAMILNANQDQLLAQEQQQKLLQVDMEALLADYRRADPTAPDLSPESVQALNDMFDLRRTILGEISQAATERVEAATQLNSLERRLLEASTELETTLDENLIWLPSAEPVFQTSFLPKLVRGTVKLLQPSRAGAVLICLQMEALARWPLVIFWTLLALGIFMMRARLRASISEAAKHVRKVREDTYLLTPQVVLQSVLIALPVPIIVFMIAFLLQGSDNANAFVLNVAGALNYLGVFLFFFLVLRAWASKDAVFQAHIGIPDDLRRGIQTETRWFIPVAGTAVTIFIATMESRDIDIYEGVSVTAFIVTALSMAWLSYRLLWGRREAVTKTLDPEGAFYRYRKIMIGLAVGLPLLAAGFTAFGFFATANELLYRIFTTGWLIVLTFVVYGIFRRTVNITHRRLSLKQAKEKRQAAIEARRREREAREDAEGDGGAVEAEVPPPVDYAQIDLEETSRQTRQLIGTIVAISFFVLLWMIWRDLLPAFGVLDSVQLYDAGQVTIGEGENAEIVNQTITLWDVVKSFILLGITVLAARNLPGFLEIFVLNRSRLEQGIRYAIVTILGYIIIAIGIVVTLNSLGVQWGQLGFIVAALGVGIGFGLQEIIANFISGIIILFERPVRVGDYVTVGDQSGTVSKIKIRATTLTDLDNKEILIPNKEFITGRVTNWTLSNSTLRIIIPVGIAYGSDTKKAQKVMLDVLQNEPRVLEKPGPQAIFVNFGASSLDFELRVFIRSFEDRFPVINALHTSVNIALEKAGITIPFPQSDLHIVSSSAPIEVRNATPPPPAKSPSRKSTKSKSSKKSSAKSQSGKGSKPKPA